MNCRNCGSENTVVELKGFVSPFFMWRIHGLQLTTYSEFMELKIKYKDGIKYDIVRFFVRILKKLPLFRNYYNYFGRFRVNIIICRECCFIGPEKYYTEEELNKVYRSYRSSKDNLDRASVDPYFASIANQIGTSKTEISNRLQNVDELLQQIDVSKIYNVLDWGGGAGHYIPHCLKDRRITILEISDEPLVDRGYDKIEKLHINQTFDYIQFCHILEHCPNPLEMVKMALPHLRDEGILYIEVPQDRSDIDISEFINGVGVGHSIHEHLNLFCPKSVEKLAQAAGMEIVSVTKKDINFGYDVITVISALLRK